MAKLRRQLHKTFPSSVSNSQDRWYLVFETGTKRLYVEHHWEHVEARRGASYLGNVRMEIAEFLGQEEHEPAKRELEQALTSMFEGQVAA